MKQFRRKRKRTDFPPDVREYKAKLLAYFRENNKDLHVAERRKAYNKFIHANFWEYVYRTGGYRED